MLHFFRTTTNNFVYPARTSVQLDRTLLEYKKKKEANYHNDTGVCIIYEFDLLCISTRRYIAATVSFSLSLCIVSVVIILL